MTLNQLSLFAQRKPLLPLAEQTDRRKPAGGNIDRAQRLVVTRGTESEVAKAPIMLKEHSDDVVSRGRHSITSADHGVRLT